MEYKHNIKFKDLKIGDKFYCWGDQLINYDSPVWCECIKEDDWCALEVDPGGIRFGINSGSEVSIEIK